MAFYRGHHGDNMVVLYLHYLLIAFITTRVAGNNINSWYLGCHHIANQDLDGVSLDGSSEVEKARFSSNPVLCSKFCFEHKLPFTLVQQERKVCYCTSNQDALNLQQEQPSCTTGCHNKPILQCGAGSLMSVYRSEGPYLVAVNMTRNEEPVYPGQVVALVMQVTLASLPNVTIGVQGVPEEINLGDITFEWQFTGERQSQVITAQEQSVNHILSHVAPQPGIYTWRVIVSNWLSSLEMVFTQTVLLPVPTGLQVALVTPLQFLPSCIPKDVDVASKAEVFTAFTGSEVEFEASVTIGNNLSFHWWFENMDNTIVVSPQEDGCEGKNCSRSIVSYEFQSAGVFEVGVNVSSPLGHLHHNISVIVVDRYALNLDVLLSPGMGPILALNHLAKFQVTVEVSHTQEAFLEADFGDGSDVVMQAVRARNGSMLEEVMDSRENRMFLTSSYGNGCELTLQLTHRYKVPGQFIVMVQFNTNTTQLNTTLSSVIHVVQPLSGPRIQGPHVIATGNQVSFSVTFETKSDSVKYFWQVTNLNTGRVVNKTTNQAVLIYTFSHAGEHKIDMNATNHVSFVHKALSVEVQDPVGNVTIMVDGGVYFASTGESLRFLATIDRGTGVDFQWDFEDIDDSETHILRNNSHSIANHTFFEAGHYNVSTQALNRISQKTVYIDRIIHVEQPIAGLMAFTSSAVAKGNTTVLVANVSLGNPVKFEVDFGQGRETIFTDENLHQVTLEKSLDVGGTVVITVVAYNNVSMRTVNLTIEVEEEIGPIGFSTPVNPVQGEPVVFVARRSDRSRARLSQRGDVLYTWMVEGHVIARTQAPCIDWTFEDTRGYNVSLTVSNHVSQVGTWQRFNVVVLDEDYRFQRPGSVAPFNQSTNFTLVNLPPNVELVRVDYKRDGEPRYIEEYTPQANATDVSWLYQFSEWGLWEVEANAMSGSQGKLVSTVISVEEPLGRLVLHGPAAVPVNSASSTDVWMAKLETGTHIIYEWKVGNMSQIYTARNKLTRRFPRPGVYNVSVRVSNRLGVLEATTVVLVEYSIAEVSLHVRPVIQGQSTWITINVTGGSNCTLMFDFGDGNSRTLSTNDPELSQTALRGQGPIPRYRYQIRHLYSTTGDYSVILNVSNSVSWLDKRKIAQVKEPISGLQLFTNASRLIRTKQLVVVVAIVNTGNNLVFDWDFEDPFYPPTVETVGHKSIARKTYEAEGTYSVFVEVSHKDLGDHGDTSHSVSAELDFEFQVVEPVNDVLIKGPSKYAAELLLNENGNYSTELLFFEAEAEGTDVWFTFDFGDGTVVTSEGSANFFEDYQAQFQHTFHSVGEYVVKVTAYNQVSNTTVTLEELFHVQMAPGSMTLDQLEYNVRLGEESVFSVIVQGGTDLTYSWDMGDEMQYVDADTTVRHKYRHAGVYTVIVKAHNEVKDKQTSATVNVLQAIQSVTVIPNKILVSTKEVIKFHVQVLPEDAKMQLCHWYFGRSKPTVPDKHRTCFNEHVFDQAGNYIVQVMAFNAISNRSSEDLVIQVVEIISKVELTQSGKSLIGHRLSFHAFHYMGKPVTYNWDFGDGTTINTTRPTHTHVYNWTGEYSVTVFLSNALSKEMQTMKVFILEKECQMPNVTLLMPPLEQKLVFMRSQVVKLETEVTVNCTITSATQYSWRINRTDTGEPVTLPYNLGHKVRDPILILPGRSLSYGNYIVQLKVEMESTIVYQEVQAFFEIKMSPLQPVIAGGIERHVSRSEDIVLDGSLSHDPDFPEATDIRYLWSCNQTLNMSLPCFPGNNSSQLDNYTAKLQLPCHHFIPNITQFMFTLTISRPGRQAQRTVQYLTIKNEQMLSLKVLCRDCMDQVNSDQRLILQADHPDYEEEDLEYIWTLYKVTGNTTNNNNHISNSPKSCIQSKHSLPDSMVNNDSATINNNTEDDPGVTRTSSTTSKATTLLTSAITSTATSTFQTTTTTTSPSTTTSIDSDQGIGSLEFNEASSGVRAAGPERSGAQQSPAQESDGDAGYPQIGEGHPGEAGSSPERGVFDDKPAELPVSPARPGTSGGSGSNPGTNDHVDEVEDSFSPTRGNQPTPIPLRSRMLIGILPEDTATGISSKALVLRKNILQQGETYLVKLNVTHKVTGQTGNAAAYFVVNRSPEKGRCDLKNLASWSAVAIEMETEFKIYCIAYMDDDLPIRYEVGYSLQEDGIQDLIYQGLNHQVKFQLPAGNASNNYQVFVHVSVLDSLGARTLVCRDQIQVKPRPNSDTRQANKTQEQILYELVEEDASTLQTYVVKGDNRKARLHAQLVAHRLNRLDPSGDNERYGLRKKIRRAMLWALRNLPMRDEYEIQQTASAIATSTARGNELTPESLDFASEILQRAVRQVDTISQASGHVDPAVVSLAMQSTANIIAAATEQGPNLNPKEAESVIENSTSAIHTLLRTELKHSVIGEKPVTQLTGYLVAVAGRYKVTDNTVRIEANNANFVLPSNMKDLLVKNARSKKLQSTEEPKMGQKQEIEMGLAKEEELAKEQQPCYETHMVTFNQNPYCYGKRNKEEVQTMVTSLTLFDCEGEELMVQNLTSSNHIRMEIPHKSEEEENSVELDWHMLLKHRMNLHQFNMSEQHQSHAMHILIDLQPIPQKRPFPIAVLLSANEPPEPEHYLRKHEFPAGLNKMTIFLEPNSLNGSNVYYLGIVDATMNAGQHRKGMVTERRYQLNAWWGECLYWDHGDALWSAAGCQVLDTSAMDRTHCGCSHLTSFGARFSLVPNDLSFIDVEEFFDLHENPVTFSFIATLLAVYLVLMVVCVRLDAHDCRKGTVVPLVDNNKSDQQKYLVCVETGFRRGAGTTAKVSMVLHGEDGMSDTRELISDSGHPLFERNSRDIFIMTLPESLGPIWKVQMWHNNAGPSPSWYLSRVTVKDVNTGSVYYFSCEKWFAVEEDDGKVDREITRVEGGFGFSKVLWSKGAQYLADYHLWISMVTRPSYSRFTRAQRLTCCLTLLMSYMAINAAWYKTSEKEYRGEFGLIDVSWRAVVIGAMSTVIVLPVNLLIIFLFRRSKVRKIMIEELPQRKQGLEKHASLASYDSTMQLPQSAVAPSIFDQSILNWQALQEWAQKQWAKRYEQSVSSSHQSVKPTHTTSVEPPGSQTTQVTQLETTQQATPAQTTAVPRQTVTQMPHPKQGYETDQTSSGFEDYSASLDRSHPPVDNVATRKAQEEAVSEAMWLEQEFARCVLEGMRSRKPRRCFLPRHMQILAWILCFLVIVGGATITVLYGFRFGRQKSILWLQSLFFSFLHCVFITHPLLVAILSVYTAWKYRNDMSIFDHRDDGIIMKNAMKHHAEPSTKAKSADEEIDLAEGIAARQRSRYLRFARPPDEKHLIEARKQTMKQKRASAVFRDSIVFTVLFLLLGFMAYGKDASSPYRLNNALKDIFVKGGTSSFDSISTVPEFWSWTHRHLVEVLYNKMHAASEKIHIANSVVVGRVSLRQLRIREEPCQLPPHYPVTNKCRYGYQHERHDTFPLNAGNETWWHVGASVTQAQGFQGRHAYYDASGYLILLPTDRSEASKLFHKLDQLAWIDHKTRAVMVELTLFNAPTNLFSSVRLVLELPATGGAFPLSSMASVYLYKYISSLDNLILACELFYMVAALLILHLEVGEVVRLKKDYFKNVWNCLQVALIAVSLGYTCCYIYRFVLVGDIVELFRETYFEEFIDVSFVAFWDHVLRCMVGVLLFLVTLTFLKLLRNNRSLAKLAGVYRKAAREITYVVAMFVIWMGAYSSLGAALFHSTVECFQSFWSGFGPIAGLMTGIYQFEEPDTAQQHGFRIFIVSFLILAVGSLTSFMVAILSWNYKTYREDWLPSLTSLESLSYFWHKFLVVTGFRHPWPYEEDEDNYLSPEFTMAEIEYQVDEMLFKMNALAGTSNLPEKPPMYFTDSDCTYGGNGDDGISSGSEVRPFDDDRFTHRIHKIEDQLLENEPHLACLLHLDSIGAEVLTEEREKQLRSQLELEIFRQLQMQRHGNHLQSDCTSGSSYQAHLTASHTNSGNSRNSTGSSDSGNSSSCNSTGGNSRKSNSSSGNISSSSHGSDLSSPSMNGTQRGGKPPFSKPPSLNTLVPDDMIPSDPIKAARLPSAGLVSPRDIAPICLITPEPNQKLGVNIDMSEGLILQDLSDSTDSCKTENVIPLNTLDIPKVHKNPEVTAAKSAVIETRLQDDQASGSGCSSGGAEVQTVLSNQPLGGARRKEYSPPESANRGEEGKLQSHAKGTRGEKLFPRDCLYDSSSSSEIDASKYASKARSLRKTKSRGKGKGKGRLSPVDAIDMIEEIGFDNDGYHSDGNKELKSKEASGAGLPQSKHKQAWN